MEKTSFVKSTLCVVAGHSSGHILPALTLGIQWLQARPQGSCIFFSTTKQLDKKILSHSEVPITHIPLNFESISLKKVWKLPRWFLSGIRSCIHSYRVLAQHNIEKVITTGGYIAVPVCIAAKLLGIPIELYELNAVPGKTIRFLSYISQTIYVCFTTTQRYFNNQNCVVISYPLQPALKVKPIKPQEARSNFGLHPTYTTILILGGSQGSLFINNVIKKWLFEAATTYAHIQIIHQTGNRDTTDWYALYKKYTIPAFVISYYDNMHQLYSAADIVVCRSGAGSLFEVAYFKKTCITIPLETQAGNHQIMNALAMRQQYPKRMEILRQHALVHDVSLFTQAINTALIQKQIQK